MNICEHLTADNIIALKQLFSTSVIFQDEEKYLLSLDDEGIDALKVQ